MKPCTTFENPRDGEKCKLNGYINCKTRFVIYCIICPCSKMYVGQTSQELCKRIQKHMSTITLAERDLRQGNRLTSKAEHFHKQHNGKLGGLRVVGLEKTCNAVQLLLQKESKWIICLGSMAPDRLNEELTFTGFL